MNTFNFYMFEYIRASNKTLQIFKQQLTVWGLEKACRCLTLPISCSTSLAQQTMTCVDNEALKNAILSCEPVVIAAVLYIYLEKLQQCCVM